ncbi:hypothetical protein SNEBB_000174 [Seison nebaliae]|nr:hypothetical protein SNEBB_000174 [Seison nebaliae]
MVIFQIILSTIIFFCVRKSRGRSEYKNGPNVFDENEYLENYGISSGNIPCRGKTVCHVEAYTEYGYVRGTSYRVAHWYPKYISVFLGIPYALPPINELRFKHPHKPHKRRSIYNATFYRPSCIQTREGENYLRERIPHLNGNDFSEDCLYLNIFAPNRTDRAEIKKYPVVVFIHGGKFDSGSARLYNGFNLAQRDIVVVTFNYRLGPLGFLSTESISGPGNYGLWDQRMVLEFVRDNIDRFNGDSSRVTLMGHDAGAVSVGLHTLSTESFQLFDKGIMLGGSDLCNWAVIPKDYYPLEFARNLSKELGCYHFDTYRMIDCLRERSGRELATISIWAPLTFGGHPWRPVIDNWLPEQRNVFLQNDPRTLRNNGYYKKLPILMGMSLNEGVEHVAGENVERIEKGIQKKTFNDYLQKFFMRHLNDYYKWRTIKYRRMYEGTSYDVTQSYELIDEEGIEQALQYRYTYWPQPENQTEIRQQLINLYTDYYHSSCLAEVARYQSLQNNSFMYIFQYRSTLSQEAFWKRVGYAADLDYIFGRPLFNNSNTPPLYGYLLTQQYSSLDKDMANYTMHLFANFIRIGNPTPNGFFNDNPAVLQSWTAQYKSDAKFTRNLNITWPKLLPFNLSYLALNSTPQQKVNWRIDQSGFWIDYWPKMWRKLLKPTPTPRYKDAIMDHRNTTIVLYIISTISCILFVALIGMCWHTCRQSFDQSVQYY